MALSTLLGRESADDDPLALPRLVERISSTIFRIRKAMEVVVAKRRGNLPYQIQDEETRFLITLREAPGKIYEEYNLCVSQIGPPFIKGDSIAPKFRVKFANEFEESAVDTLRSAYRRLTETLEKAFLEVVSAEPVKITLFQYHWWNSSTTEITNDTIITLLTLFDRKKRQAPTHRSSELANPFMLSVLQWDLPNRKVGTLFGPHRGNIYEGTLLNGERHGRGVLKLRSGDRYVGGWLHNRKHGWGIRTQADGTVYNGDYEDGVRSGCGVLTLANGEKYDGQWRKGQKHGYGTYTWRDGSTYQGSWRGDMKHGFGLMIDATRRIRMEGFFERDRLHGEGILTAPDGPFYQGGWNEGSRCGEGINVDGEGREVSGGWLNDTLLFEKKKVSK